MQWWAQIQIRICKSSIQCSFLSKNENSFIGQGISCAAPWPWNCFVHSMIFNWACNKCSHVHAGDYLLSIIWANKMSTKNYKEPVNTWFNKFSFLPFTWSVHKLHWRISFEQQSNTMLQFSAKNPVLYPNHKAYMVQCWTPDHTLPFLHSVFHSLTAFFLLKQSHPNNLFALTLHSNNKIICFFCYNEVKEKKVVIDDLHLQSIVMPVGINPLILSITCILWYK